MIRYASRDDIGRISEILVFDKRITYREIFEDDEFSFNQLQVLKVAKRLEKANMNTIMVYDDGILKGMLSSKSMESMFCVFWELDELYVDYFFQGQGIGKSLFREFYNIAKNNNVTEIFTWIVEKNYSAIEFYKSIGFVDTFEKRLVEGTKKYEVKYKHIISYETK